MDFPNKKNYEYSIKAPGFKGVFFLRCHYLEDEIDIHATLTLNPFGIKIPWKKAHPKVPKLEYEARSVCKRSFLAGLYNNRNSWSDIEPGEYKFFEKDGIKNRQLTYQIENKDSISVEENGEPVRVIGIPGHRDVPFLDPLQFLVFACGMIDHLDLDGILVAGKYREANLEMVNDTEYSLFWTEKDKRREVHLLLNRTEQVIQTLVYQLPVIGKVTIDLVDDLMVVSDDYSVDD